MYIIAGLFKNTESGGEEHPETEEPNTFDEESEDEVLSGKIADHKADEDFLTFPGQLGGIIIKPIVDTGGGCNIVKAQWLRDHGLYLTVDQSEERAQKLLMADGSTSKTCYIFDGEWRFDDRKQRWKNVEFIVVEDYKYDALIGLPFLKHTETIHNSEGRLVFPEFKGVHAKKEAIPIYNTHGVKANP